ncbi:MAG: type II toxin-antitoxin system Phd/YefM family antitoxin [Gemmatales bacterium]
MLNLTRDIRSLSEFKRNTPEMMKRLRTTGQPVVLTINGKAELVVQTTEGYQELLEMIQRQENMQFIEKSRSQVEKGKFKPMRQVVENLGVKKRK